MSLTVAELNKRSVEIFRELVDAYVETGEPVGSRTLSRRLTSSLSPATIRNVMADLEEAGLLYAPHTSAGRLPTEAGLRFFVHGLLELGDLTANDRAYIDKRCTGAGRKIDDVLEEATSMLSGLSKCAGLVLAPKNESPLKHVEFVSLGAGRAILVMITEDGVIENRIIEIPVGIPAAILIQASNYLNARLAGRTLAEAKHIVFEELSEHKASLDILAAKVVEAGIGVWSEGDQGGSLIIKGQGNLLTNVTVVEDLNHIRDLFTVLDTKETLIKLLDASIQAEGVQIFIGAENNLFSLSGCSLVVAPYKNSRQHILGAIGVVGPTRMNYGKIIPLVDYTAKLVGQLLE
jgi:heat-inducible transcriptional repressor